MDPRRHGRAEAHVALGGGLTRRDWGCRHWVQPRSESRLRAGRGRLKYPEGLWPRGLRTERGRHTPTQKPLRPGGGTQRM
jgi:hypothetical protein